MSKKHAVLAVILWSTVASAFKLSLRHLTPLQLLFYASLTSLLVFGLLHSREFSLDRRDLRSVYLGLINPFLYYLVLFSAYDRLPAQEAQALNYTWPLMLVLLSIPLLGRRPEPRTVLGLLVGFAGALVIATKGELTSLTFSDPLGVALGLGSAVIWASYWLLNLRDERPLVEKMFWNFLFGFAYVSTLVLVSGEFQLPPLEGLAGAVYVGLFEMGVTFLLWYRAVEGDMAFASSIAYLVPFLSLFFISLIVGEKIAFSTILGLVLIVTGIVIGKK
ncbi:permease, drug/metabolite transporter (DMT) superfamily [Thermococcus kodakarensis KOD1]|uniref:Permease, drug/metabolite transporter (DMT) superfamily n=1 Tax=Thermococcus kodakarensis (strain ATCC BAA-918 / JCM 12380 / KOD1) TaxID=69014 RepID=Q5JDG2_THEKO|nr:DMT family transporter [Thermococcus kodakarensis]WCN27899.1 DMT family transporter [Thermococcus kodakarensis]WCN30198.1 DMT family transporter [Thermococcus kodakarensis]BAD86225.1 permease, drug/metabolite transporter (DMT) superfamily [Thermococcus kodakarensis KOD1]